MLNKKLLPSVSIRKMALYSLVSANGQDLLFLSLEIFSYICHRLCLWIVLHSSVLISIYI